MIDEKVPAPAHKGRKQIGKRIILLLDGTWNDADFGDTETNIVRMREIIARTLWDADGDVGGAPGRAPQKNVKPFVFANKENIVFYHRGVGTNAFLNRWVGGAFGEGLTSNIRQAYKFLSYHYREGDQIFVFGFSRGAYTARSLVGYINAAGLLTRDNCTFEREQRAWDYYRCAPSDRLPGAWSALTKYVHERERVRITCIGVFDTVGALGVPLAPFMIANRDKYEFHDVELSSISDLNLHAIAVDEHREPFAATVWRRSKFKNLGKTTTEQVWFAGAHSDIGGGYIDEEKRAARPVPALDDITLNWMLARVTAHHGDFPAAPEHYPSLPQDRQASWAEAEQHDPRTGVYRLMPRAIRSIANRSVPCHGVPLLKGFGEINVSRDRHAAVISEMVHISVLMRLGKPVLIDSVSTTYAPRNIIAVLDALERAYGAQAEEVSLRVVGWDGKVIEPGTDAAALVVELIRGAKP